jgi:hypothetical protein
MPDRHVYWIMFTTGREDQPVFGVPFECRFATVRAVSEELARAGVVEGAKLHLTDDGRGGRLIRFREDFAFGAAGLHTIQNFRSPVWEPEA